ncbi:MULTISPECIES: DMT family transporter [Calditerrivibrio]|uniref:DMT family transporter n=1 Tax=Calditerrivibrio TaxID=545865 RepID=UPI003C741683
MITGIFYSLFSATCFGFLAIFGKYGTILKISATELLTYRFIIGSLFFILFFLLKDRKLFRIDFENFIRACVAGGIFYLLMSYFFFKALEYVPASTTSLILYIYPFTVSILSMFFFKIKISRSLLISLILIASGCILIFYDAFNRSLDLRGVLFAVLAMLVFSFYLIYVQKTISNIKPITFSFYVIFTAGISFSISNNPLGILHLNSKQLILVILIGIIPTFLAVTLQFIAIEKIGSVNTAIFSTVEPIVTVSASYFLLGDNIVIQQVMGMFMIILGIVLPNLKNIKKRS